MSVLLQELASLLRPASRGLALREAAARACRQAGMTATAAIGWDLLSGHVLGPGMLGALAAFLALAALVGLVRIRVPLLAAARAADVRLGLADQLATAVDLLGRSRDRVSGLAALQVGQALEVARTADLRSVAPVRVPREWSPALAAWAVLVVWTGVGPAVFPAPGATAVRQEGHVLRQLGERLAERSRAAHLPETRRAAFDLLGTAARMERGGVSREQALGLLRRLGQRLRTAQETLEHHVASVLGGGRVGQRGGGVATPSTAWVEEAIRTLRAADDLMVGRPQDAAPMHMDRRLRDLAALLARSGAPPEVRHQVDRARRDLAAGSPRSAEAALGEALQDLRAVERMLGDVQGVSEARRAVGESSQRLALAGEGRAAQEAEGQHRPPARSPSLSPGPVPPTSAQGDLPPPSPGPHEGSQPGEGRGGALGAPTPRLRGTRLPVRLDGAPSGGPPSSLHEVVAPGRTTSSSRPPAHLPADVAHQLDLFVEQDPLPPSYVRVVQRYFAGGGGGP